MRKPQNPFDILLANKKLYLLNATARGAVYHISGMYYQAGCPDITIDYKSACGMNDKHWSYHSKGITQVLEEVLPQMAIMHHKMADRYAKLTLNLSKAHSATRVKKSTQRLQQSMEGAFISDVKDNHTGFSALPSRKDKSPGMHDVIARNAIIKANKADKGTMLTDK